MKHVMKSLKHNGIFVPPYDLKGFSVKIQGQTIKLTEKTEPMAMAWSRRVLSTTIPPPDKVFTRNFMKEFLEQTKERESSAGYLNTFITQYLAQIDNLPTMQNQQWMQVNEVDFIQVKNFIIDEKAEERSHKQGRKEKAELKNAKSNV